MKHPLFVACLVSLLAQGPAHAANATWITNVKLVSPERLDRIETGSVLIEDGRIAAVVRGSAGRAPAGARVVDGDGKYLSPGLIDSHVHLYAVPGMSFEQAKARPGMAQDYFRQLPRSYLYFGYTTLVDLAVGDRGFIDRFKQSPLHPDVADCGAPAVFANGYPMSYSPSPQRFEAYNNFIYDPAQADSIPRKYRPEDHTPEAVVEHVRKEGAVCVKTHLERGFGNQHNLPVMGADVYARIRAAAARDHLTMVTHANSFEMQSFAVAGDVDVLAHGMWHWGSLDGEPGLPPPIRALLDKIIARHIGYQPTMQVLYGLAAYVDPGYLSQPAVRKVVPPAMADWYATPEGKWFHDEIADGGSDEQVRQGVDKAVSRLSRVVAYLAAHDANILFGTDTPSAPSYGNLPGLNGYLEMRHLHEAGLSLAQLFKAATISNARAFGLDAKFGSIEPGKVANLLLMTKSPLEDIDAYDSIVTVWVGGRQVARDELAAH